MLRNHIYVQTTTINRYWHCCKKASTRCPARLRFDEHFNLVFYKFQHTHPPPPYFLTPDGKYDLSTDMTYHGNLDMSQHQFEIIQLPNRKRPQLSLDGHMFSQTTAGRRYWHCNKNKVFNCRARLRFNEDFKLTHSYLDHTHAPGAVKNEIKEEIIV